MLHYTKIDSNDETNLLCLQDTVHIGTKLRNRLLATVIVLVLGSRIISVAHLKLLINNVPKEVHGLVLKDICPDDRQNYGSLEKVMQPRVIDALTKHVVGSEGTVMYLQLCEMITSSLCLDDLLPLERLYRIWYATYFFRLWRKWIQQTNNDIYKLPNNFISANAYLCVEINASNLKSLTKVFRNNNMDEFYMPSLFNSQPNEEIFRQLRSMGTLNYTKINFTLLELFHLVRRIELQNHIVYIELANKGILFPRNNINKAKLNKYPLPSDVDISKTMNKALNDAVIRISSFGINIEAGEISSCEHIHVDKLQRIFSDDVVDSSDDDTEFTTTVPVNDVKPNSFIDITLENGTKKVIRKSTFLWTLTDPRKHLSNDRLKRVQQATQDAQNVPVKKVKRQLIFKKEVSQTQTESILTLCKNDEIQIGDWCIFEMKIRNNREKVFVLGNVLSFNYIKGKTAKERQYSWEFAPTVPPKGVKERGVEVLASWYEIGSGTHLSPIDTLNCFHIDIKCYVYTMDCPNIKVHKESLSFTNDHKVLEQFQQKLYKQ